MAEPPEQSLSAVRLGSVAQRIRRIASFLHRRWVCYTMTILSGGMTIWEIYSGIRGLRNIADLPWITVTLIVFAYGFLKGIPHVADDSLYVYRKFGKKLESGVLWLHAVLGERQSD